MIMRGRTWDAYLAKLVPVGECERCGWRTKNITEPCINPKCQAILIGEHKDTDPREDKLLW